MGARVCLRIPQIQCNQSRPKFLSSTNNHRLGVSLQSIGCRRRTDNKASGGQIMLWTIFVILLVLWLLGLVSSYTLGGYIHILLLIALVVLILQLISGRRPVL